jgi:hypothetical protein
MTVEHSSETSGTTYQAMKHHIPEDRILDYTICKNLGNRQGINEVWLWRDVGKFGVL